MTMPTHILLVEDDPTARRVLTALLQREGYIVIDVAGGAAAIDLLTQQSFDVVVTDICMDDVDGIEVLQAAREQLPPPTVIMLTGYRMLDTAIAALRAGAHDYLTKPCAPEDLLASVARAVEHRATEIRRVEVTRLLEQALTHLRDKPSSLPSTEREGVKPDSASGLSVGDALQIGRLHIDLLRHTASFADQPLHLTRIEYTVLSILAKSAGRVLTYQELACQIYEHTMTENEAQVLLRSHIYNLRRKIPPGYLVNVRGTGYLLTVPDDDTREV